MRQKIGRVCMVLGALLILAAAALLGGSSPAGL